MTKRGKKGQITIFVIIAILIIGVIIAFILFGSKILPTATQIRAEEDPESYIDSCIKEKLNEASILISERGGNIKPVLNITLDGQEITYLCYTANYYNSCVNQNPMLITHLKQEIKNYVDDDLENCFESLKLELENKGYNVGLSSGDFNVELAPRRIILNIDRELTMTKSEQTERFDNFKAVLSHPIYDLAIVAQEIVSQEAQYCNFESVGFMLLYSDFNIDRFKSGRLSTIYTITHKPTNKQFKFAVRGCVIPPGF